MIFLSKSVLHRFWTDFWIQNGPKMDPKSFPNPIKIDHLYKFGFYFDSWSISYHILHHLSNERTLKIIKNQCFFCWFLYIRQNLTLVQFTFQYSFNLMPFWLQNSTKSDPEPSKININSSNDCVDQFVVPLGQTNWDPIWTILGPSLVPIRFQKQWFCMGDH